MEIITRILLVFSLVSVKVKTSSLRREFVSAETNTVLPENQYIYLEHSNIIDENDLMIINSSSAKSELMYKIELDKFSPRSSIPNEKKSSDIHTSAMQILKDSFPLIDEINSVFFNIRDKFNENFNINTHWGKNAFEFTITGNEQLSDAEKARQIRQKRSIFTYLWKKFASQPIRRYYDFFTGLFDGVRRTFRREDRRPTQKRKEISSYSSIYPLSHTYDRKGTGNDIARRVFGFDFFSSALRIFKDPIVLFIIFWINVSIHNYTDLLLINHIVLCIMIFMFYCCLNHRKNFIF